MISNRSFIMTSSKISAISRTNCIIDRVYTAAMLSRARVHNFLDGKFSIYSEWSQTDAVRKEKITFEQSHALSLDDSGILRLQYSSIPSMTSLGRGFPFVMESGVRTLWDLNYSDGIRAICCEYRLPSIAHNANKSTMANCPSAGSFVHLWNDGILWKTLTLPCDGSDAKHGKVISNTGSVLSGARWSHDNKRIVYLAEHLPNSNEKKQDAKPSSPIEDSAFLYKENWGELLQDVCRPTICILDVNSETIETAPFRENSLELAASDPVWCPGNDGIVFVGYDLNAYNLGLTYCTQRQSAIYFWNLNNNKIRSITNPTQAVRCPRFSPDGSRLIWLEHQLGGPHRRCDTLKSVKWPLDGSPIGTIVPEIRWPESGQEFPGLFCDLAERCWTRDGKFVLVSSIWGFTSATLLIPMVQAKLSSDKPVQLVRLPNPLKFELDSRPDCAYTTNVLDVHEDIVIASVSTPSHSPCLAIFALNNLDHSNLEICIQERAWFLICGGSTSSEPKLPALKNVDWFVSTHQIEADQTHPNVHCFESLLVAPRFDDSSGMRPVEFSNCILTTNLSNQINASEFDKLQALVVMPHGGPHSNMTATWSPITASFLLSGFACLFVNYRGSLGYGQDFVDSLLGYIGEADVADCVQATRVTLQTLQKYNPDLPVVLFGGSHGGFLSLHLAARYPDLYRAVVVRNPVTHLVSMIDTSDIPDWCYTESGIYGTRVWPLGHLPTEQDLNRLAQASPLAYLNSDWKVPLLLCLGGKDCRVPMSQGLIFYKKVKALCKDVPCQALVYSHDSHPLDSVSTSLDVLQNTLYWFRKHLNLV